MVTITVFYKEGLKRGPPANGVTFSKVKSEKLAPGFPGATTLGPLKIVNQTQNRDRVESLSAPLSPEPLTIRVTAPSGASGLYADQDTGMNGGDSTEVWLESGTRW